MFDQIAVYSDDLERDVSAAKAIGFSEWTRDVVEADATVMGSPTQFRAKLAFNYQMFEGIEFEFIQPTSAPTYITAAGIRNGMIAHVGIHVDGEEDVKRLEGDLHLGAIVQDCKTTHHSNAAVPADRRYHYTIYWCPFLSFPVKLIRRLTVA